MVKAKIFSSSSSVINKKTILNYRYLAFSSPYNNEWNNKIHFKNESSNELTEQNKIYPTNRTRANA